MLRRLHEEAKLASPGVGYARRISPWYFDDGRHGGLCRRDVGCGRCWEDSAYVSRDFHFIGMKARVVSRMVAEFSQERAYQPAASHATPKPPLSATWGRAAIRQNKRHLLRNCFATWERSTRANGHIPPATAAGEISEPPLTSIGPYQPIERIGAGGMSSVYRTQAVRFHPGELAPNSTFLPVVGAEHD